MVLKDAVRTVIDTVLSPFYYVKRYIKARRELKKLKEQDPFIYK